MEQYSKEKKQKVDKFYHTIIKRYRENLNNDQLIRIGIENFNKTATKRKDD